jgi:capreomycidine synthase
MEFPPALLEDWMREYYFNTNIDIGSSGVENFSLGELRNLFCLTQEELDRIVFHDSLTLGDEGLRRAIARRWQNGDPEQVMVTHGSSEAIYLIMNALLEAGDEVVVLDPSYHQLHSTAAALGCRLKRWRLRQEQRFVPDVEQARKLIGPLTRMVVVNFPHNPTGASLSVEQQSELIAATAEVGAYLLWDAAFAELTYDCPPLPQPNSQYERSISTGTLSKSYGLPGLRVGWFLAAPEVLARCARLRDYITLHLSPLVELIARRAIEGADALLAIRVRQAQVNLEILAAWADEHQNLIEWVRPQGGVCAFLRLRHVPDVEAFCRHLARNYRVLLVPGTCFDYPDYVRLGFGGATSALEKGLACLSELLKQWETKGTRASYQLS